jgi:hypothetical protein
LPPAGRVRLRRWPGPIDRKRREKRCPMRCTAIIDGRRCQEEEGHDTGVGTPHLLFTDAGALPSAEVAARELSQRLGIPCTAIPVGEGRCAVCGETRAKCAGVLRDDGDLTCAQADGTPEGAARQAVALAERVAADLCEVARERGRNQRARVLEVIVAYLAESERDWQAMFVAAPAEAAVTAIQDAKQLHDAQLAELFERIGAAL